MDRINHNNVVDDDCPVKKTEEIIHGKWMMLVIRELLLGKKRYSEIQKALDGISPKILTSRLRLLESRHLVERTVYPTVPPTTEYELTQLGEKLKVVIDAMAQFGTGLKKL